MHASHYPHTFRPGRWLLIALVGVLITAVGHPAPAPVRHYVPAVTYKFARKESHARHVLAAKLASQIRLDKALRSQLTTWGASIEAIDHALAENAVGGHYMLRYARRHEVSRHSRGGHGRD